MRRSQWRLLLTAAANAQAKAELSIEYGNPDRQRQELEYL